MCIIHHICVPQGEDGLAMKWLKKVLRGQASQPGLKPLLCTSWGWPGLTSGAL